MRGDAGDEGDPGADARAPARRRMRALGDAALVDAMRGRDAWAWEEFYLRFHPGLALYARRIGVPDARRDECIDEVLEDVGAKLAGGTAMPQHLNAYLMRAVRNRAMQLARAARRERQYIEAAGLGEAEQVAQSLCSEDARRASRDVWREVWPRRVAEGVPAADDGEGRADGARRRLMRTLDAGLTEDERRILGWLADALSHREIAELLGVRYDAATKRIWRLLRRLRAAALLHAERTTAPEEQAELRRFFRRVQPDGATMGDRP